MQYLIDTHIFLWAITDNEKLSKKLQAIMKDASVKIYVSAISLLDAAIKLQASKMRKLNFRLSELLNEIYFAVFEMLPFENENTIAYSTFAYFDEHRDPFGRLLIAIAHFENMAFISKDKMFELYKGKVEIVW